MKKAIIYLFINFLLISSLEVSGQTPPSLPERTGILTVTQTLHFGDLTLKTGASSGTVTVDYNGSRTATGDVILLNMGNTAKPAIFQFKLCPGRTVIITYSPTVYLTGSNGGSILLHIGPTSCGISGAQFTSNKGCDDTHYVNVGGTIDISPISSNPAGLYTGSFDLTFNQQ